MLPLNCYHECGNLLTVRKYSATFVCLNCFVDDEPMGSHRIVHKKRKPFDFLLWVPYGILRLRLSDFVDVFAKGSATCLYFAIAQ